MRRARPLSVPSELFACSNLPDRNGRIKSENAAELNELDDIDTPLTAFEPRHERLIFPKPFCQLRLSHTGSLAPLDQERDKGLVSV